MAKRFAQSERIMRAFLLVCLLASAPAVAEEVRIAVGMNYDTVVANIKRCGGKDMRSGLLWLLQDYDIQILSLQQGGKIWSLSYQRRADLGDNNREGKPARRVKSLTFDTDKKAFAYVIDEPFVFVVAVHNVPVEGEPLPSAWDRAHGVLARAGIRHSMESAHGLASIEVEPTRSREALRLIQKDAAETGYSAHPAKEYEDAEFICIATINEDAIREVRAVFRNRKTELWIDGRGPALVGINVKKTDVATAVEAISTAPQLQKRGLVIKKEYLPLLK
jgi:hypothetical protein